MKNALLFQTNSSRSGFNNGGVIRSQTIERLLISQGFRVETFEPKHGKQKESWHTIVLLGPRKVGQAIKIASKDTKIWIDMCDSWLYSRFSWTTGPRLFLLGIFESLVLLRHRKKFKEMMITYVTPLDREMDKWFLKFIGQPKVEILNNEWKSKTINLMDSREKRFVFVGAGNYFPNLLAALELSFLLAPKILDIKERRKIHIYGHGWPTFLKLLPNLVVHNYENDEKLYFQSDVHLAPLRQRAGIKNKVTLPLSIGIPVIAYETCLNGIPDCKNLFRARSISDFIKQMNEHENEFVTKPPAHIFENECSKKLSSWLS